ncbi:MAG: hypothetical protein JO243_02325, partial [Solirubrobacterales bacterium]|nr:hypothetical protein [Solirubrobacterales bacterium]
MRKGRGRVSPLDARVWRALPTRRASLTIAPVAIFALVAAMPAWAVEPAVCSGCKPPLVYTGGGLVMSANAGGGITVTPIYWEPSGGQYKFPAGYERAIDDFMTNVAAASGGTDNAFSIPAEYYQDVGGTKTAISYRFRAGTPLTDTTAFPGNGCTPASGHPVCLTDA